MRAILECRLRRIVKLFESIESIRLLNIRKSTIRIIRNEKKLEQLRFDYRKNIESKFRSFPQAYTAVWSRAHTSDVTLPAPVSINVHTREITF